MMVAPNIEIHGDRLSVHFTDFSAASYPTFLRVKALPEYELEFVPETETYRITAPARFAAMLGVNDAWPSRTPLPLADFLFDDQLAITTMALECKRFAYWGDCGLGKTLVGLEFGRQVIARTGQRYLQFTLNDVVPQWIDEARRFYGESLPICRLNSREEMRQWAGGKLPDLPMFGVVNYEKLNFKSDGQQVVNELRNLGGVGVDENRLKSGGGKQKWALIKSCKGIEHKLSLTATPAPNDYMEYASQASFLEKMRSDDEILWTYFSRNEKTHRWSIRPHAREPFFKFMAGWSIYVRDPKKYGWRAGFPDIPPPQTIRHALPMTAAQGEALRRFTRDRFGQLSFIDKDDRNAVQRGKLSQIAKGFYYTKGEASKRTVEVESEKPDFVADLCAAELADGHRGIIWTAFDAESDLICAALRRRHRKLTFEALHGSTKREEREAILGRFRSGDTPWLVTKASLLGFGMNFQFCDSNIVSGFNDSYEAYYQLIRRTLRYDQKKTVRIHLPVVEELEGDMLENLFIKAAKHEAAIDEMERNYIRAMRALKGAT